MSFLGFKKSIFFIGIELQLFNYDGFLVQGTFLLNLWPIEAEKQVGPAPDNGSHPNADTCPLLRYFQGKPREINLFHFTEFF